MSGRDVADDEVGQGERKGRRRRDFQTSMSDDTQSGSVDANGFCKPSREHLARLMRQVFKESRDGSRKAQRVGAMARRHMAARFSPEPVARTVLDRIRRLTNHLDDARTAMDCAGIDFEAVEEAEARGFSARPRKTSP